MASLIHLARNCPQLKTLDLLPLIFTQTTLEDVESFPLLDHGLRELNIEQVRLDWEQYSLSALLLDRIFPHLEVNARDIMADPSGGFRRLERCVWLCQQARRQQEQRVRCHAAQDSSSLVACSHCLALPLGARHTQPHDCMYLPAPIETDDIQYMQCRDAIAKLMDLGICSLVLWGEGVGMDTFIGNVRARTWASDHEDGCSHRARNS